MALPALADSISFTGSIEEDIFEFSVRLGGSQGFSLHSSTPDGTNLVGSCSVNACDASGSVGVFTVNEPGFWSASLNGVSINSNDVRPGVPVGSVGGMVFYTVTPFDASLCAPLCIEPATYSGEVFALLPDHSSLFDLSITGSGVVNLTLFQPSPTIEGIHGVTGTITGTATPIPEPSSFSLVLAPVTILSLFGFRKTVPGTVTGIIRR